MSEAGRGGTGKAGVAGAAGFAAAFTAGGILGAGIALLVHRRRPRRARLLARSGYGPAGLVRRVAHPVRHRTRRSGLGVRAAEEARAFGRELVRAFGEEARTRLPRMARRVGPGWSGPALATGVRLVGRLSAGILPEAGGR